MTGWASGPLEGDTDLIMSSVERGLTVGLIATFEPLGFCEAGDDLRKVANRKDLQEFDHVPVKENGAVVGFLERTSLDSTSSGTVREAMTPLHGNLLISSEAGILSYIEHAGRLPCRLVLSQNGVDGIVTLSDLQKLPARPALFLLITHLELLMTEWIRRSGSEQTWLNCLSPGRREKVEHKWNELQANNLAIDRLSAAEFADKRQALLKLKELAQSKARAEQELKDIEKLRNSVAHAGDYALTRDNARNTVQTVRDTQRWIADLQGDLSYD